MLDDEKLLEFIKVECAKLGVTGYDIGKNTPISEQSAYKILNGVTEKPRRKNLIHIVEYLESLVVGTEIGNQVNEPEEKYESFNLYEKHLELQAEHKKLIIENYRLRSLLEKHKIKF